MTRDPGVGLSLYAVCPCFRWVWGGLDRHGPTAGSISGEFRNRDAALAGQVCSGIIPLYT
jgi:hypothetical protein